MADFLHSIVGGALILNESSDIASSSALTSSFLRSVRLKERLDTKYYTELDHIHIQKSKCHNIQRIQYIFTFHRVTLRTASFLPSELPLDDAIFTKKRKYTIIPVIKVQHGV